MLVIEHLIKSLFSMVSRGLVCDKTPESDIKTMNVVLAHYGKLVLLLLLFDIIKEEEAWDPLLHEQLGYI